MRYKLNKKTGCHEFLGCKTYNGYGRLKVGGKAWMAHRYALSVHLGRPIKEGLVVLHSCDNPSCVNPEHLSEGTQKQNMEDCRAKGRMYRPGHKGNKQLSTEERLEANFRKRVETVRSAKGSPAQIAARYGFSLKWVHMVLAGTIG